jgi:hypothetical protein
LVISVPRPLSGFRIHTLQTLPDFSPPVTKVGNKMHRGVAVKLYPVTKTKEILAVTRNVRV